MRTKDWAQKFAQEWVEAWNAHDIERVLSHYTDDFEMNSPFIVEFADEPSGILNGKTHRVQFCKHKLRLPDDTTLGQSGPFTSLWT